jgi:hypothetical protein
MALNQITARGTRQGTASAVPIRATKEGGFSR